MNLHSKLTDSFPKNDWPLVKCPTCHHGTCEILGGNIMCQETAESIKARNSDDWEGPEMMGGNFYGNLVCTSSKCGALLFVGGTWFMDYAPIYDSQGEMTQSWIEFLKLEYINPPLEIHEIIPATAPKFISDRIREVSKLVWLDPSAAGTRLRLTVEKMLTTCGIEERKPLHLRIEKFKKTNPSAADALMAIKYFGNDATHDASLNSKDVFEALVCFEAALRATYSEPSEEVKTKISKIISSRSK